VLFPALLTVSTATADLKDVPAGSVALVLFLAVIALSGALFVARVPLMRALALSGPAYSSMFQGATRWNTYVGLAVGSAIYGTPGLALISVAIVAMVPILNVINVWIIAHYAAEERPALKTVVGHMLRNPFIWSSLAGIAINLAGIPLPKVIVVFGEILGRASLALGLLLVGAGLVLGEVFELDARVYVTAALKLFVMPMIAIGIAVALGLSGVALSVVAIASSAPSAPSGYVLARQLGGDAPLLARILTFETLLALVTIPLALAVAALRP
jgi:malonate transporter and related proteins